MLQMIVVLWILLKWEQRWLRGLTIGAAICTGISGLLYVWDWHPPVERAPVFQSEA